MHFRYYRAANAANDARPANRHLSKLLALNPSRADVVLEVVPALNSLAAPTNARAMFNRAQAPSRHRRRRPLQRRNPQQPRLALHRCDEHPEEAVQLALKAPWNSPPTTPPTSTPPPNPPSRRPPRQRRHLRIQGPPPPPQRRIHAGPAQTLQHRSHNPTRQVIHPCLPGAPAS